MLVATLWGANAQEYVISPSDEIYFEAVQGQLIQEQITISNLDDSLVSVSFEVLPEDANIIFMDPAAGVIQARSSQTFILSVQVPETGLSLDKDILINIGDNQAILFIKGDISPSAGTGTLALIPQDQVSLGPIRLPKIIIGLLIMVGLIFVAQRWGKK
jgi:hypothetical protein